jgi:hypothetical protein
LGIGQDERAVVGAGLTYCNRFTVRGLEALVQVNATAQTSGRQVALNAVDV